MTPTDYQVEIYKQGLKILRERMIVYLACEERVGKTLPAIMISEKVPLARILVLTKKAAIGGWVNTLEQYKHVKQYTVTNYHQASKHKAGDYNMVILDEAHNYISGFPKMSTMWCSVRKLTKGKPLIYISATPCAQGYQLLYHQFKLSDWSPWSLYRFSYDWFKVWGIPDKVRIAGGELKETYKKTKPEVFETVKHLFVTKTREEAGFKVEPIDNLHYIDLKPKTKLAYNTIVNDRVLLLNDWELVCDSVGKLRASLHMLEGGVMIISTIEEHLKKPKKNYIQLGNTEKVQYILDNWGDDPKTVIMYNYIAEETKLKKYFKHARILQATRFAEGVDLWEYDNLVIYSMDFSTARFTQRRARQTNRLREDPIAVHFLLVKDGISDEAYKAVAVNKQNYIDRLYRGKTLTV